MLLLMAIHFHSNQLSAICDLVCQVLGVKVPIRPNNMTRLRQIFTQEIFTEQVGFFIYNNYIININFIFKSKNR